jgi:hypothetical protein
MKRAYADGLCILKAVIHRTGNEIDQCNLAEKC